MFKTLHGGNSDEFKQRMELIKSGMDYNNILKISLLHLYIMDIF